MISHLCNPCKQHFKEVLEYLDSNNIPYFLNNYLVRGLDYYSKTVFEIFEDKSEEEDGSSENSDRNEINMNIALGSGGRYDQLAKMISNKDFPGCGGALGIDRIVQTVKDKKIKIKLSKQPKIFFVQLGNSAKSRSLNVIEMFRRANLPIVQSIGKDSLKSQLRIASKMNMPYTLILGQKEAMENSIIIRDMNLGSQETVSIEKVVEIIKKKLR
jgi:histidyl-tRNA synthetase